MTKRTGCAASRDNEDACEPGRRNVIRGLAVSGWLAATGSLVCSPVVGAQEERSKRAQPGDHFVFMAGDREGQTVTPGDIDLGGLPILVYPKDPATEKILKSRANLLLLMRLRETDIDEKTKPHAADGIVAYSAICTHEGCPISNNHESEHMAVCNCHGSTFDVGKNGAVVQGPAIRRLAMLPVTIADGALVVAGELNGPIGPPG